jgi:DNA primase
VGEGAGTLRRRLPLLDYLEQHQWKGRPAGRWEYVGLCPLHEESQPSFYVNTRKNVFYCHGCGQGGDLIRLVQLSRRMSFRQSLACLNQESDPQVDRGALLEQAAGFYQQELDLSAEAMSYLRARGVHDPALIRELSIGYAAGGKLRRYLAAQGHSFDLLRRAGLINAQGADALYQRIVFPLRQDEHIVNLYGRSIGSGFAHRFLPGSKGRLYGWEKVRQSEEIILVEGLFDYAVLRQAGFSNVTCSLGTHLNPDQFSQLCKARRSVYVVFDSDRNQSGQRAAQQLIERLQGRDVCARRVLLPAGQDPNSFFLSGGDARQFQSHLKDAQL